MIFPMTRGGLQKTFEYRLKLVLRRVESYLERVRGADQAPISSPHLPHPPEERHLFSSNDLSIYSASPFYRTDDSVFDRTSWLVLQPCISYRLRHEMETLTGFVHVVILSDSLGVHI